MRRRQKERQSDITVHVTRSDEAIDFDAWARRAVSVVLAAVRREQSVDEAA